MWTGQITFTTSRDDAMSTIEKARQQRESEKTKLEVEFLDEEDIMVLECTKAIWFYIHSGKKGLFLLY